MKRPNRVKRVIRCEVCDGFRRLVGSSKVWIDAVSTNPITNKKTMGGYVARICRECRPIVGYGKKKKKDKASDRIVPGRKPTTINISGGGE